ncbi:peptide chain release factor 1, mitochondrial isoform X1 [Physeter macrocephalus]|uniref:Peptide chain release factor 1, mitochondrial isoform X1 n=1 Tax=Physeter macrocephalus TaxID=9755 RepID=A0A2Y9SZ13_PHYMC|nr:peptide chain release factor 1, mitochondrial isoform X1 [Physeter catodon]XP_023981801.1 peptide chain release factor 1, mitochondrial isoform X1 [Physeter catodon]XP_023981802.1 peptide chain release factor 1, mitochondrial isoform X1 [Physeter catodon]XP_023981804.1 peptide chain release factor 1, mitochondrial isoform X1 [Physeter catodon]XP_023981805.1 peptide chain release factor 1, mitochondrial isoform X1 [Physeter catodon]XP_028353365.1 peptide chain release factor 1, mitochondrial|eukprot:XP_023981800.1 peptide chain release factor 1, mitochondrial [Physeter catodon]
MNRHLFVWLFRHPCLNGHHQCHVHLHSHRLTQIPLDTRLWVFRQNRNHMLHCLLSENWSRRYCHQDTRMLWKRQALQKYMEDLSKEYQTLDHCLQHISVSEADRRSLNQRHAELAPLAVIYKKIQEAEQAIEELESMCKSLNKQDEKQLQELALEERQTILQKINMLYSELLQSLVPKEKCDKNDVILEVTSGRTTGGDICQQFTREIFDMYQNYSSYKHWKFELLNYTPADYGGLHHAAARISGDNVYKHLKYEGGIHRVQRIPEVGLSSRMQRIHTGTMSVIVLPQPDEVDVKVDPKDLRIDTFRAKGAGGQHVNTTDSAVRLVHVPTGLVVECQQERSQIKNKEIALRVLRARLYQQIIEKDKCQQRSVRKLQVGTRAQSERIRTYNFTQDRVTDHRIAYEVRNIKEFLCGEKCLDQLIRRLLQSADEETINEVLDENLKSAK